MGSFIFIKTAPQKIINTLENNTSLLNAILVFAFSISLRTLIESFSQENVNYLNLPYYLCKIDLVHFGLSYSAIAMLIMILFHCVTGEDLKKIAQVVLPFFVLLLIAPLVDIVLTNGKGYDLKYFLPESNVDLIKNFLTYCSFYKGISIGLRLEIFIYIVGFYCYFREKGITIIASLMYAFLGYTIIFIWGCSPIITQIIVNFFGFEYNFSGVLMINFFSILVFLLASIMLLLHYRTQKIDLYSSFSVFLSLLIMQIIGFYLGLRISSSSRLSFNYLDGNLIVFSILFSISLIFFAIFIKTLKNKVKSELTLVTILSCSLSLIYADLISVKILFIMFSLMGLYYFYYFPPILLKRFSFANLIIHSFVYTLIAMSSYLIVRNEVTFFPKKIFFYILLGMLLYHYFQKFNIWYSNASKNKITIISD